MGFSLNASSAVPDIALMLELERAGMLSLSTKAADVVLSAELRTFKPAWEQGTWLMELALESNWGNEIMRPTDTYRFANTPKDEHSQVSCESAAYAIAPAVQKMIRTVVSIWYFQNKLLW